MTETAASTETDRAAGTHPAAYLAYLARVVATLLDPARLPEKRRGKFGAAPGSIVPPSAPPARRDATEPGDVPIPERHRKPL